MTDTDLRSEIAAIRETLKHIERQLDAAASHRDRVAESMSDVRERLRVLEAQRDEGVRHEAETAVPQRLRSVEQADAAQEAVAVARADLLRDLRALIFGAIAATAAVVGLITTLGPMLFGP